MLASVLWIIWFLNQKEKYLFKWIEELNKNLKQSNFHGLGYCSFKSESAIKNFDKDKLKSGVTKLSKGVAFGTGALEDSDTFGEMEDYVERLHEDFKYDIDSEKSDSDNEENKWSN